ncbi:MAG: UbiX family flavin prenyltransferase [Selenomonas sp.]|uniref:UbiX family flavin prenyltransferase n=1 Tax=Selenomonas bovis TaxID=416586 RepID=UPI00036B6948|nr:UbiX family flavin prenyltransferase [Selenomonas bovis]MBQ1622458.1 UbiX family flavin prenyltransferase [Selenomonas sp.]MCI6171217.1 UbiX family flavin prenyltransferase [Selenomonas bovis]MCI7057045.1 UbiX family flavin prenyltransferase [Selenomonas bovis]
MTRDGQPRRLIIGISGASGVIMAARLLRALRGRPEIETQLVATDGAWENFRAETALTRAEVEALADVCYDSHDLAAPIASGTYETLGMLVLPCSMKTLAGLVTGYSDNLLLRAGDVCLKEGRPLVLVPRETPLSRLHLRNLKEAADLGMTIVPPMLSFYSGATTVEQQVDQILGKALRFFGIDYAPFVTWQGSGRQDMMH